MLHSGRYKAVFNLTNKDIVKSYYPDINLIEKISVKNVKKCKRNISHRLCVGDNFFIDCYYSDIFVIKNSKNEIVFRKIYEIRNGDKMAYYNFGELLFLPISSFFSDTRKMRAYDIALLGDRESIIIVNGFLKRV